MTLRTPILMGVDAIPFLREIRVAFFLSLSISDILSDNIPVG